MVEDGFIKKNRSYIDKLQSQLNQTDNENQRLKQLLIEERKQFEELEAENFDLRANMAVMANRNLETLRKQLEQAQARIIELEEKQVYPAAIKKDSNGNPITSEIIVKLFNSGMNPNQISKKIGNITHQAIRARLKKLGLYGNR